jgi:hypothetical protein
VEPSSLATAPRKKTNASVRAHTGVLKVSAFWLGAADVVANTLIPASIVNDAGTSEYTGLQEGVNAKRGQLGWVI